MICSLYFAVFAVYLSNRSFFTKEDSQSKLYSLPDHWDDGNKQSPWFLHDAVEPGKAEFFYPFESYFGFSDDYIYHTTAEVDYSDIKVVPVFVGEKFFFWGGDADEENVRSEPVDLFHNFVFFYGCKVAVSSRVNCFYFIVIFNFWGGGTINFFGGSEDH